MSDEIRKIYEDRYKCVNYDSGKCGGLAGQYCSYSFLPNYRPPTECPAYQTQEQLDEFNKNNP